eukprot:gene4416-5173_t
MLIFSVGVSLFHIGGIGLAGDDISAAMFLSFLLALHSVYAHRLFMTTLKAIDPLIIMFYFAPITLLVLVPTAFALEGSKVSIYLSSLDQYINLISI